MGYTKRYTLAATAAAKKIQFVDIYEKECQEFQDHLTHKKKCLKNKISDIYSQFVINSCYFKMIFVLLTYKFISLSLF